MKASDTRTLFQADKARRGSETSSEEVKGEVGGRKGFEQMLTCSYEYMSCGREPQDVKSRSLWLFSCSIASDSL